MIHGIESMLHKVTKVVVQRSKALPARVFCLSDLFKFCLPQISTASSLNGGGPPSHRRARDHDWHGMPSQIKTTWCCKLNFQRALMTAGSKMLQPLLYSMSQAAQRKPFLLIAWDICAEPLKISTNQTFKSSSSFGRKIFGPRLAVVLALELRSPAPALATSEIPVPLLHVPRSAWLKSRLTTSHASSLPEGSCSWSIGRVMDPNASIDTELRVKFSDL